MEQTQLLDWDEDGSTDGLDGTGETPKPVGRLHLLSNKYGIENDFWIYPGENVIGRLESCHICLPASSVSKIHAVIEVPSTSGQHLLYDQGSLNRTRRQRVTLIPQVRYSLQDGDILLFGDVGCQYFILVPEAGIESSEDSMVVPPTQARVEASVLTIEETPAPRRQMGFGEVLVQDSDKEEEVVNGTGKTLHHPARDGSDCSNKKGFASLASSGVSSPSAAFVPESDEESGDPSIHNPSCPVLHLSFDSQDANPSPKENGGALPSSREDSVKKPGAIEAELKSLPDGGEPTVKEEGASVDPSQVGSFHLDSDTDVEDENQVVSTSGTPEIVDIARNERGLQVDTDLDDSSVIAPATGGPKMGSDTDVEEAVESPDVLGLKPLSTSSENGDDDTDVEAEIENPRVVCEPDPSKENDCKGTEGLEDSLDVTYPKSDQPGEKRDGDTDVEEALDNQDKSVSAQNEDADTDGEDPSLKRETPERAKKNQIVGRGGEGNADEELVRLGWGNSEVVCPQNTCSSSHKDSSSNKEEIHFKGVVPDNQNSGEGRGDAVGLTATSDVEHEMSCRVGSKPPKDLNGKEPLENPERQDLPALSLDSDTDMEVEADNPDAESEKSRQVPSVELSKGSKVDHLGNPAVERNPASAQDRDGETDEEATSLSPEKSLAHDSDTDGEEGPAPLPGKPLEEQGTQLIIPLASPEGGEPLVSSAVEVEACHKSCEGSEETDGEREESYSADDSNTDDESDLTLQATQCFLLEDTTPPGTKKAEGVTAAAPDSSCTVEEEPTQAFDFRSPFLPAGLPPGNASSSSSKGDTSYQEAVMLETTQPFCEEPEQSLEEATQAVAAEEELEKPPSPDIPASASRGQETPGPQPCPVQLASRESSLQAAEGAAAEPLHSGQIPPAGSHPPSTLQAEERVDGECAEAPEGGQTSEPMLIKSEAGEQEQTEKDLEERAPADGEEEGGSVLGGDAGTSRQALLPAEEEASSALERRRSLRSSTSSASPAPVPERRSLRCQGSGKQAAPSTGRRGLQQPGAADKRTGESEERPEAEGPRKKAKNGDGTAAVPPGRTRCSQRESRAASRATEALAAAGSPGPKEPARRVTRGSVPKPGLEEPPRTRASRRFSCSASATTPSPRDSGKEAKPGQESAQSTPSSRRRFLHRSTESQPTGTRAPSCNRLRGPAGSSSPAPKVLFTGVIDEDGERIVAELGGSLAESVFDCTHLVTDRVRRTVKFLCALARGIPIVTLDWLEKSRRNAFFLAPKSFLVWDPEQEKNLQFSLTASLQRAQQKGGLFQGYEIHVTPNAKPEPEYMRDIVKCSGGTFLPRMPRAYKEKRIVVSCPEDLPRCKPAQDAGIPITSSEFILTGILQQKVELGAHRLDGGDSPSATSSPAAPNTRASKRKAATQMALAPPSTAKRRR